MADDTFKLIKLELGHITPHFREPAKSPFARDLNPDHNFPFRNDEESVFAIRNSIPVWADAESNIISGIIVYDIRPEAWTLIYCHTAPLYTYNKDYGCDFYDIPFEIISNMTPAIKEQIILSIDAALQKDPDMHEDIAALMIEIAEDVGQADTKDFSVDIYIPPVISPYTGERYFRPGNEYGMIFDNPLNDVDYTPQKKFMSFLHHAVTQEMPKHGLKTQYDLHIEMIKKFGNAADDDTALDRRELPDTRLARKHMGSDRKRFTNLGLRIGANRR